MTEHENTMKQRHLLLLAAAAALVLTTACANDDPTTQTDCSGGKCDTPGGKAPAEEQCEDRRQDVIGSAQATFVETAIRWACSDVQGVNTVGRDDRGQEYCEYYAIVQPPPVAEGDTDLPPALQLGRLLGNDEDQSDGNTTGLALELTEDQTFWLEDNPDEVVGSCVFHSWHADIEPNYPACDDPAECPDVHGFELNARNFRMKVGFNSNSAAAALVRDCLQTGQVPSADDSEDPLNSEFYRGCLITADLYGTQWRRSDPAVCAAAMRLVECGCGLPDDADVPTALVPTQPQRDEEGKDIITLRGFPLGTWSGLTELPQGCKYGPTGDDSQTLVLCDLTAADLLVSLDDPKGKCQEKYGDNVVVHVPIPQNVITCEPPEGGPNSETCGDTPWVVAN